MAIATYSVRISFYPSSNWKANFYASDGSGGLNTESFAYGDDPTGSTKTIYVRQNDLLVLVINNSSIYPRFSGSGLSLVRTSAHGHANQSQMLVYKVTGNVSAELSG